MTKQQVIGALGPPDKVAVDGRVQYLQYDAYKNSGWDWKGRRQEGTSKGYVFPEGIIGELVALLSLCLQARFFVLSTSLRNGGEHDEVVHKAELVPLRGRYGPHLDRVVFSEADRNITYLGPLLDKIARVPATHHLKLAVAADHYARALRTIGVDEEMVFVRLVSAIEKMMGNHAADSLSEKLLLVEGLSADEKKEIKTTLNARRSGARFIAFFEILRWFFFRGKPANRLTRKSRRKISARWRRQSIAHGRAISTPATRCIYPRYSRSSRNGIRIPQSVGRGRIAPIRKSRSCLARTSFTGSCVTASSQKSMSWRPKMPTHPVRLNPDSRGTHDRHKSALARRRRRAPLRARACLATAFLAHYASDFEESCMTNIHIPDETAAQLRQVAQADGRTVDELAGEGLAAYLASRAKLDALRAAIDEGDASGIAEDSSLEGVLAEIRARRKRPPSQP